MQLRGRISVVPAGHCSPGWMGVPRPPPRPRPVGCWPKIAGAAIVS